MPGSAVLPGLVTVLRLAIAVKAFEGATTEAVLQRQSAAGETTVGKQWLVGWDTWDS